MWEARAWPALRSASVEHTSCGESTEYEDRARFDNAYIDDWSLWQDVCILLRTAVALVRLTGS